MIEETRTVIERHHTYKISFKEFWEIIKDSDIITKSVFYSGMFPNDHGISINLDTKKTENYIKALNLKGKLQSIFDKNDMIEITTIEREEK